MKTTPQAALISLSRNLKRLARSADMTEFQAFVSRPSFMADLTRLDLKQRMKVMELLGATQNACNGRRPIPKTGTVRVEKWDAAMIAKLRAAEAKHGDDKGIARELGIPLDAARVARWKYIGRRADTLQKAA